MTSSLTLAPEAAAGSVARRLQLWLGVLVIAVLTTIVYWPALRGGFIWDDDWLILNNRIVRAPDGLWRMWFTTDPSYYWPVTNSIFWLEWRIFGTETLGYHLVNLVLHIAAALLVWRVLSKLGVPGSFLAALLWAVHPVNVEGVAWISQLKTVLSAVFCLLSIWCYLQADEQIDDDARLGSSGRRWYLLSVVMFLLGMLSKASIAPLPLLLLVLTWWRRSRSEPAEGGTRICRRDLLRVIPFLIVALALVPINMWFETHGSGEVFRHASFLERLLGAGAVPWFYLGQAVAPWNLMFIHPSWPIEVDNVLWWLPLLATLGATALLLWQRNTWWGRSLLFAWASFLIGLIPVLGFTDVSLMKYTLVSDHYQYLSLIAVTGLIGAGLTFWFHRASASVRWLPASVATSAVAALMIVAFHESGTYRDVHTLLETTILRNPDCWVVRCGLGILLTRDQKYADAIAQFEEVSRLNPKYPEVHDHWGRTLALMGRDADAVPHYERAIELAPDFAEAHNNFGATLLKMQRLPEAIQHFTRALELRPSLQAAHANLATSLARSQQWEQAAQRWKLAIQASPGEASYYNDLGVTLLALKRYDEAFEAFQGALRIDSQLALAYENAGQALVGMRQPQPALEYLTASMKLGASSPHGWFCEAAAKEMLGQRDESIAAAQNSLQLARARGETAMAQQLEAWLAKQSGSSGSNSASPLDALPASSLPPSSDSAPSAALPPVLPPVP